MVAIESNTFNIDRIKWFIIFTLFIFTGAFLIGYYFPKPILHTLGNNEDYADIKVMKFESYLKKFNKSYIGTEYVRRFRYFKESLKKISKLNDPVSGSAVFGLTKFADMSPDEKKRMTLPRGLQCSERDNSCILNTPYKCSIPNKILISIDRRKEGVVKPVLDQKRCNGCWAFSVVGLMESMAAIIHKDYRSFSIQELIDCSYYTNGCVNGSVVLALDYLCINNVSITTEHIYPLTLKDEKCLRNKAQNNGRKLRGYCNYCNMKEYDILKVLSNHGPVAAVVNADPLFYYVGGVIQRACIRDSDSFDHVIQIVGYDLTSDIPYYIVRNSWGTNYGEKGYIRIEIGHNLCGIAEEVAYLDVI